MPCTPNALTYKYSAAEPAIAVFSEIYYPGWKAQLEDCTEIDLFRADYVLRAAALPAGDHTITMRFDPPSYRLGAEISLFASIALIISLILSLALFVFKKI